MEPFDSGTFLDFAPLIDSSWTFFCIPPFSPVSFSFQSAAVIVDDSVTLWTLTCNLLTGALLRLYSP